MFDPWGGYSIIGFGDIILPGLIVAFSLRFVHSSHNYLALVLFESATMRNGIRYLLTCVLKFCEHTYLQLLLFLQGHSCKYNAQCHYDGLVILLFGQVINQSYAELYFLGNLAGMIGFQRRIFGLDTSYGQ